MIDTPNTPGSPSSRDLVFNTGRWDRYRWDRYLEESEDARALLDRAKRRNVNAPSFAREVFSRLCGDPTQNAQVRPEDSWASTIHQEIESTPDFARLAHDCAGDRLSAGLATCEILASVLDRIPRLDTDPENVRQQVKSLLDFAKAQGSTPEIDAQLATLRAQGKALVERASKAGDQDPTAIQCAAQAGIDAASARVAQNEGELDAIGGYSAGTYGTPPTVRDTDRAALSRAIRSSPRLKKIAELAGRLKRIASEKQRTKADHAHNEISDIEQGNDIGRVLPSELVLLAAGGTLALDFARRYTERQLLQYRIDGREEQGRGPIVVLIDQSSSMECPADKDHWAKAFALALAQIASLQKRQIAIVLFNSSVTREIVWKGQPDVNALTGLLNAAPYGGTEFAPPLARALDLIRADDKLKKADVIMITDGEAHLEDHEIDSWNAERKRLEVSCYAISIASTADVLTRISDKVITIGDVAKDIDALTLLEI